MNKYITHHVHVYSYVYIESYWYNYIHALWITMIYMHLIYGEKMREKPYRHPQSKKLTMLGIFDDPRYASCMSIWCSYVGGPSAVPIRWAVFFRNNTHTLWDVCFVEFLWGKWFSLLKRFFGWLPPTVLYIYLPVPGGTNHFRPTVSAHFSPSLLWMGCLHACSTVICVCSPVFLRGVAQLSASIVFCSQLCLKFISQYLRFFVLQSPEGVQNVRGLLRNTSRNVLWEVSPTVIYSIWNQSQSLAIFLGRFPKRFSGGFHQSWSMYHCRTSILKENNTPIHLHSAKDQSWYSLDLFQKSNFEFHMISSYFRPWTAKSKWMSNVPRCLVTCDSWKGFGDKSGAEVNRCPRSPVKLKETPP